jgi:hypothetical protein
MKAWLFALAVSLQEPPAPAAAPSVEPWSGSFRAGFARIEALARDDKLDEAREQAERLLAPSAFLRWRLHHEEQRDFWAKAAGLVTPLVERLGWNGPPAPVRAEIGFARGLVELRAERTEQAEEAFAGAVALAGPGELRLQALYNHAWVALDRAEKKRAELPEIAGQGAAATPAPTAAPATPGAPAPDPLKEARASYLSARARFIERLKADADDADSRANAELIQRRLRELDEIEKKREEEKQKQEQQDQDSQDKDKDSKDKDDSKQDPSKDKPKEEPKDQEGKPEEDPQPDQKPPEEPKQPEEAPKPEEKPGEEKQATPPPPPPGAEQMSKEQMTQILDRLRELEEQARRVRERLRQMRKTKVAKDW